MTVAELIAKLQKIPQDMQDGIIVVMSRDREGNGHSPLEDWWFGSYEAETTWRGTMGYAEINDNLRKQGYTEEDLVNGVPAICLCPIN